MHYIHELKEGLAIAYKAIMANKMRSALTTLGIVIGIVSVTLMGTAIEGLDRAFNTSISKIGADVLYIQKWPGLQVMIGGSIGIEKIFIIRMHLIFKDK